jgi:hypothetical protein
MNWSVIKGFSIVTFGQIESGRTDIPFKIKIQNKNIKTYCGGCTLFKAHPISLSGRSYLAKKILQVFKIKIYGPFNPLVYLFKLLRNLNAITGLGSSITSFQLRQNKAARNVSRNLLSKEEEKNSKRTKKYIYFLGIYAFCAKS